MEKNNLFKQASRDKQDIIFDDLTYKIGSIGVEALNTLYDLMKNATSFVIAHRLSTIQNADKIIFVENGNIVEQGSHKELLELKGKYYELYNSQFTVDK